MKKLLFFLLFISAACAIHAQISFGLQADGILGKVNSEQTSNGQTESLNGKSVLGWKAGVVARIPIDMGFSFMPQLNVIQKGSKFNKTVTLNLGGPPITYNLSADLKLTYLEMPLYAIYDNGSEEGFFGGLGPIISFGLSGKEKDMASDGSNTQNSSSSIKFDGKKDASDDNIHFKRIEIGAGAIVGYRMSNGLFINAHYNLGLNNIDPDTGAKTKTSYFGIGIGYLFGRLQIDRLTIILEFNSS